MCALFVIYLDDNNAVDSIEGEKQTFTCITDSSRPAVWIQWYNYLYFSTGDNSDNHTRW
jgi:hypothetical protein